MRALTLVTTLALVCPWHGASAQRITGTRVSALPALNYNSDEGFGYGVIGGIYGHGDGAVDPYYWAVEPLVFFTTNGRRELRVFGDLPYALQHRLRISGLLLWDQDCCQPYYGLGNATTYDAVLADPDIGPNFYTYSRERVTGLVDLQWPAVGPLRVLVGYAAHHMIASSRSPETRFAADSANGVFPADDGSTVSAGLKLGLVLDTRDQERDPRRGVWIDALVWRGMPALGSDGTFTRWTGTFRGYLPVTDGLNLGVRVLGETVTGDMPVAMLPDMGSSLGDLTELGGGRTIRGVFRARLLDRRRGFTNLEARWRGSRFGLLGQELRPGLVAFFDAGRVWSPGESLTFHDLKWGTGGGGRLTWGDAFIVTFDVAYGREAGVQFYIDVGQLF
jgi:Omp85 superfamily domain